MLKRKKLKKATWGKIKKEYPQVALQQPGILSIEVDEKGDRIIVKTTAGEVILTRENFHAVSRSKL